MIKRKLENLRWREVVWHRPYEIDAVLQMLSHLASFYPRGAIIWEARGRGGYVRYHLGADSQYIGKIEQAIKAHGSIQFYDVPERTRKPVSTARQLKITRPVLSLNTNISMSVIRAVLAAMATVRGDDETVLQIVLGGSYAPSPVPAKMADPNASWLQAVLGNVGQASTESRSRPKEKAGQHVFQAVIRVGATGDAAPTHLKTDRTFALGMNRQERLRLSISPQDSLEHTHILGPTGSGKSTAMLHLILSDIKAGRSVLVIDPKADLVNTILERIPEERADEVVVLDPSDPCPVGFNPFAFQNYKNKSLIADAVLAVLKEIFAENWGIRSQDILSGALLTLAETEGASLLWLPTLLTDETFRQKITSQLTDQIGLIPFWEHYEAMRDSERRQEIAPVMNKLRQFLFRPGLRNVLGQSQPKSNLTDMFYKRRVVLVPLNRAVIGAESARLLGSLIVGLTWTLALSRASIPPERRHIVSVFIDELQDYLSLPTDLSDALAQARGLGMALTLAHQYLEQLPSEIRAGVAANARNKIVFGLNSGDAKDMAAMAPDLTPLDFMTLPRYQIYASFQQGGKNIGWVQGQTMPAPPALRQAADLRARSQTHYGRPAEEVEAEYLKTLTKDSPPHGDSGDGAVGRKKKS